MNDTPFTTVGDEPVEARIVAWVLGEASGFEIAELERLCEERPELLVFRRRMLAMHGLLAEVSLTDDSWKLSPEKRKPIDEIFGQEKVVRIEVAKEKRIRRAGMKAFFAIAACVVLTIFVLLLVHPIWIKQTIHEPEKKVDFMPPASDESELMLDDTIAINEQEYRMKPFASNAPAKRLFAEGSTFTMPLSAELVEGTPKPINVPNLELPVNGPAGYSSGEEAKKIEDVDQSVAAAEKKHKEVSSQLSPSAGLPAVTDAKDSMKWARPRVVPKESALSPSAATSSAVGKEHEKHIGSLDKKSPVASSFSNHSDRFSEMSNTGSLALSDRRIGFQPVREDSASRLSAHETTGGTPIGQDRRDAYPPAKLTSFSEMSADSQDLSLAESDTYDFKGKDLDGVERSESALSEDRDSLLAAMSPAPEKPKPNLAQLIEEISATEDPYSTFSLNISDASFQIAQAALANGEHPDPAGIKVEQFYNAVDYGDPAPSAGESVALAIEQSAHPIIPGRYLVRVALKTAAAGRAAAQPLSLTLLADQSGSMVREDRRAAMDKALNGLAGLLTKDDHATVIGFSRTPRLLADNLAGDQAGKMADLVNQSASEGGTNLEEAIKLAGQKAAQNKLAGAQNRIVLFTDGAANLGDADPARLAEKVKELRQKGIAFDIAGIVADGLNDELLAELARNGNGRYYVVGKGGDDNLAKQLAGAFRPAAENVKLQVRFNPERVGRYKLIGFEKDRLKTEDFRNDKVDAAELAAEEAGVAIYQVEIRPEGHGEIGEVSVRFRDAASTQMVERTWTIPHDVSTATIDRAAPSMQLAVLSMLAAEKLKGGPLGDAIDFKQLAAVRANVRQFYGNTGRAAEMLRMIDSL